MPASGIHASSERVAGGFSSGAGVGGLVGVDLLLPVGVGAGSGDVGLGVGAGLAGVGFGEHDKVGMGFENAKSKGYAYTPAISIGQFTRDIFAFTKAVDVFAYAFIN